MFEPDEATTTAEPTAHTHDENTALDTRLTVIEGIVNSATENNVDSTLVLRKSTTNFEDIVARNVDIQDVSSILSHLGYFYWENPSKNQFIQIGASLADMDPAQSFAGIEHYHEQTANLIITGDVNRAPLQIESNTANTILMFSILDSSNNIRFSVNKQGYVNSEQITSIENRLANIEARLHILESNTGLL